MLYPSKSLKEKGKRIKAIFSEVTAIHLNCLIWNPLQNSCERQAPDISRHNLLRLAERRVQVPWVKHF